MAMLMLGGAELCEGDVKGWNSRLPTMRKMLMSATDTEAQLSREWKGMAFNAIYHDVLSAVATTRNMALPIEQYQKLLDKSTDPDTYMGVALQVFALLAEVASIASRVSEAQKTCASDKISQLVRLHAESNAVLERLNNVEPPRACYVPDKMHMVFAFHAYRSAAELFMRQTVLRAAPTDIRTQVLVERTLLHLRLVIDTPSESQMLLPLFVVGVDTVGVDPRAEIVELFNRFNARVLTGNIKTVHNLLQEVWKRNPDGDRWVDWRQIADEVCFLSLLSDCFPRGSANSSRRNRPCRLDEEIVKGTYSRTSAITISTFATTMPIGNISRRIRGAMKATSQSVMASNGRQRSQRIRAARYLPATDAMHMRLYRSPAFQEGGTRWQGVSGEQGKRRHQRECRA